MKDRISQVVLLSLSVLSIAGVAIVGCVHICVVAHKFFETRR